MSETMKDGERVVLGRVSCVCVCVCVCIRERETDRQIDRQRQRQRESEAKFNTTHNYLRNNNS